MRVYSIFFFFLFHILSHLLHLFNVALELLLSFSLLCAVPVDLLQALGYIFLVLLAVLVELDARLVVRNPAFAEVAVLASLGFPVVRPVMPDARSYIYRILEYVAMLYNRVILWRWEIAMILLIVCIIGIWIQKIETTFSIDIYSPYDINRKEYSTIEEESIMSDQ